MTALLLFLCTLFFLLMLMLAYKIFLLRKSIKELREEFEKKLQEDTNVGIRISTGDRQMRLLATSIDKQLQVLRNQRLRYVQGDLELKNAITGISHDLRTPLTAICGYLELLKNQPLSESASRYLSVIEERTTVLTNLTEELFRYSIILSEEAPAKYELISLNSAIEDCLAGFYAIFQEKQITPEILLPATPVMRYLAPQSVSRILSNIVSNALKYSDGDFLVKLQKDGSICFSNHTRQLDSLQVDHLFDRFFTVKSTAHSTGLGLAIARTLTEDMGGEIHATCQDGLFVITISFPTLETYHK